LGIKNIGKRGINEMLNYIAMYPNKYEDSFNDEVILGLKDKPLTDFIIMAMKEFEAIENIDITKIEIVDEQDKIDLNQHLININFKKKDIDSIEVPKFKFREESRYGEIIFTIDVHTNLNRKIIKKHILYPIEYEGFYYNNGKKMKAIWQLIDASTYSQRGKNTLKSRMPIIIYQNKNRFFNDISEVPHRMSSYSYALNTKSRKPGAKIKTKFINPIMIYCAKMGFSNTIEFFGMKDIVFIDDDYNYDELEKYYIFPLDSLFIKVDKELFEEFEPVKAFVCMTCNIGSKDFPLSFKRLEDTTYWINRIGTIGSAKSKNLDSFHEKGLTAIYMIERLLDQTTIENLRLPDYYKTNIYYLMYWMIMNFDDLRKHSNIDMSNKRLRRNEYIVNASLGKKINENINRIIEKRGKSKMNNMDTLLELFNFPSDIILSGMRNLNDLIKSDDIVNDLNWLLDLAYSSKGTNALGQDNSKMISDKYRYIHPSMLGKLDMNVSSNSDVGMSGSLVPTVQLYNGFYFTPEVEPCGKRYEFDKELRDKNPKKFDINRGYKINFKSLETYIDSVEKNDKFRELLEYEPIEIIEKEPNNNV
jgi:hypothetical protein